MATTWLDILRDASQNVVTPLVQQEILGRPAATELALVRERNANNQLNGSGAPDPVAAIDSAARGTELNTPAKFSWGDPFGFLMRNKVLGFLVIGAAALIVFWFIKRR